MMNPRENFLAAVNWQDHDYMPSAVDAVAIIGDNVINAIESPEYETGYDMFGVHWIVDSMGPMHDTNQHLLEDICDWREVVKFPDLDTVDFHALAAEEKAMFGDMFNHEEQVFTFFAGPGPYERLMSLMGCEEMLCALMEEPEECAAFFQRVADHKIDVFRRTIEAFEMDIYLLFDDVATVRGLFMAPEVYKELIWPAQKRICEAVTEAGVVFGMHTCGLCEDILPYYVEMGAKLWQSAQPVNDIAALLKKFEGKLAIQGGWNTEGPCSLPDATVEQVRAEVDRCAKDYGFSKGYLFDIYLMNKDGGIAYLGNPGNDERFDALYDEYLKVVA